MIVSFKEFRETQEDEHHYHFVAVRRKSVITCEATRWEVLCEDGLVRIGTKSEIDRYVKGLHSANRIISDGTVPCFLCVSIRHKEMMAKLRNDR